MGEAKRRKAQDPNFGKETSLIKGIAKVLSTHFLINTLEIACTSFVQLKLKDIVYVNLRADADARNELRQQGVNPDTMNHPILIRAYQRTDTDLPEIPDLRHLAQEADFEKERILAMWFPDDVALPNPLQPDKPLNTWLMTIPLSVVEEELKKIKG
ncbi:MAG: hypothetical protein KME12_23165 [Trichocoleus desertorum ATA4-8-CV12]|jgi:hypothetical protein|nr:hypothetical protein [Trichocoleus desertorum ATA4-8-CV12]